MTHYFRANYDTQDRLERKERDNLFAHWNLSRYSITALSRANIFNGGELLSVFDKYGPGIIYDCYNIGQGTGNEILAAVWHWLRTNADETEA